jgi:hypothetical protein
MANYQLKLDYFQKYPIELMMLHESNFVSMKVQVYYHKPIFENVLKLQRLYFYKNTNNDVNFDIVLKSIESIDVKRFDSKSSCNRSVNKPIDNGNC